MSTANVEIKKRYLPKGAQSHHVSLLLSFIKVPGGGIRSLQLWLRTLLTTEIGFRVK